jgi:hypothetical protein
MAVLQTNFSDDIAVPYAGSPGNGELSNDRSIHLEGSTACEFGRPVYQGTADKGGTLTVSANLLGFALRQQGLVETSARPADSYAPGDTMAVRDRGTIYVDAAVAVDKDEQVYVTSAGVITNVSTSNTAATGWVFDQTIAAAGRVQIARR